MAATDTHNITFTIGSSANGKGCDYEFRYINISDFHDHLKRQLNREFFKGRSLKEKYGFRDEKGKLCTHFTFPCKARLNEDKSITATFYTQIRAQQELIETHLIKKPAAPPTQRKIVYKFSDSIIDVRRCDPNVKLHINEFESYVLSNPDTKNTVHFEYPNHMRIFDYQSITDNNTTTIYFNKQVNEERKRWLTENFNFVEDETPASTDTTTIQENDPNSVATRINPTASITIVPPDPVEVTVELTDEVLIQMARKRHVEEYEKIKRSLQTIATLNTMHLKHYVVDGGDLTISTPEMDTSVLNIKVSFKANLKKIDNPICK